MKHQTFCACFVDCGGQLQIQIYSSNVRQKTNQHEEYFKTQEQNSSICDFWKYVPKLKLPETYMLTNGLYFCAAWCQDSDKTPRGHQRRETPAKNKRDDSRHRYRLINPTVLVTDIHREYSLHNTKSNQTIETNLSLARAFFVSLKRHNPLRSAVT